MTITSITPATFISDTLIYLRDTINTGVTDPRSAQRPSSTNFVMTSFPEKPAFYPLITVEAENIADVERLGLQSEATLTEMTVKVRVWSRSLTEKDKLAQSVMTTLRTNQTDATGSIVTGLHDYSIINTVDVDEIGEGAVKSKIIRVRYRVVLT